VNEPEDVSEVITEQEDTQPGSKRLVGIRSGFFARRGHAVYRVSSAKAADLRRFLRRQARSNGIRRGDTCLADPRGSRSSKVRIKDLVRKLLAMTPLAGDFGTADLAVLDCYADPRTLAAADAAELTRLIAAASGRQQGEARAQQWLAAAAAELAAKVVTEVRLLDRRRPRCRPHDSRHQEPFRSAADRRRSR
jgi:hypothetical protein